MASFWSLFLVVFGICAFVGLLLLPLVAHAIQSELDKSKQSFIGSQIMQFIFILAMSALAASVVTGILQIIFAKSS